MAVLCEVERYNLALPLGLPISKGYQLDLTDFFVFTKYLLLYIFMKIPGLLLEEDIMINGTIATGLQSHTSMTATDGHPSRHQYQY